MKFHREDTGFITAGAWCNHLEGLQVLEAISNLSYVSFRASNFLKVSLVCQTHHPQFDGERAAFPLWRKEWSQKCRVSKCGGRLIFHSAERASSAWNS